MVERVTITETCSCSASISVPVESASYYQRAANIVSEWRKEHRHEFPPAEPAFAEPPFIHESQGAAVERSWAPESDARPTVSLGFQRNEVR